MFKRSTENWQCNMKCEIVTDREVRTQAKYFPSVKHSNKMLEQFDINAII
jgi:hypothetical protein